MSEQVRGSTFVEAEFVSRAMAAATALAGELHLRVDDAVVIHNSRECPEFS
jgi:hypothetical protein